MHSRFALRGMAALTAVSLTLLMLMTGLGCRKEATQAAAPVESDVAQASQAVADPADTKGTVGESTDAAPKAREFLIRYCSS